MHRWPRRSAKKTFLNKTTNLQPIMKIRAYIIIIIMDYIFEGRKQNWAKYGIIGARRDLEPAYRYMINICFPIELYSNENLKNGVDVKK